jgi:acylphosphatase
LIVRKTIRIKVSGKVQGVFYRQSTLQKAKELHLCGEVWNNTDGTVGIFATGDEDILLQLTDWCSKGPSRAEVDSVEVTDQPLQEFSDFSIRR